MEFHEIQVWLKLDKIIDTLLEDQLTFMSAFVTSITMVMFATMCAIVTYFPLSVC
jgi:hypothetical protein